MAPRYMSIGGLTLRKQRKLRGKLAPENPERKSKRRRRGGRIRYVEDFYVRIRSSQKPKIFTSDRKQLLVDFIRKDNRKTIVGSDEWIRKFIKFAMPKGETGLREKDVRKWLTKLREGRTIPEAVPQPKKQFPVTVTTPQKVHNSPATTASIAGSTTASVVSSSSHLEPKRQGPLTPPRTVQNSQATATASVAASTTAASTSSSQPVIAVSPTRSTPRINNHATTSATVAASATTSTSVASSRPAVAVSPVRRTPRVNNAVHFDLPDTSSAPQLSSTEPMEQDEDVEIIGEVRPAPFKIGHGSPWVPSNIDESLDFDLEYLDYDDSEIDAMRKALEERELRKKKKQKSS